mgnify:CR=1 FL=1
MTVINLRSLMKYNRVSKMLERLEIYIVRCIIHDFLIKRSNFTDYRAINGREDYYVYH